MEDKEYQWFVEPKTDHANEVISRSLAAINEVHESVAMKDNDGAPHAVYQLPGYGFITRLYKSSLKSTTDFNVYCREGHYGPIRLWTLGEKKKNKKNKKK